MVSRSFTLKYGKGNLSFEIPEKQLLCEIKGKAYEALPDLGAAYRYALENPIHSPPLSQVVKPGQTVAITVSDITRAWQKSADTLPVLLECLNEAGVPDENVTIVIAVGAHRGNSREEMMEICGEQICHRVRVINHDAWDKENMVYLGKTSRGTQVSVNRIVQDADRLILTGAVIYHFIVGYGGGRKSVMPGICSVETIRQSHNWALGPELGSGTNSLGGSGRTKGNPAHEDMMDVASFVRPDFIVNVVPNLDGKIAGVFAGNWVSAWLEATKLVDEICGVPIDDQADIVIATAGGYPKDISLYQAVKTLDNASHAMKPGGVSIILSECSDIREPADYFRWFDHPTTLALEEALRERFAIEGWGALATREFCDKGLFILVTREENDEFVRKANLLPAASMEEALAVAYEKCGTKDPRIIVMPQGANTLPILGKKS